MFILTISGLTTSSLPWFMDSTFQVLMQYCPLQLQSLLSSPDISTTGCHFCFGPAASFFLGLLVIVLCSPPVAYWTPSNLGDSSLGVISFSLFIQFMRSSRQVYQGDLYTASILGWSLLQWITFCQNSPPPLWPIHLGWPSMAIHSFIELCKSLLHDKAVICEGASSFHKCANQDTGKLIIFPVRQLINHQADIHNEICLTRFSRV